MLALLPLVELAVFLLLGSQWGWWQAFGLIALTSVLGLLLVLVEGRGAVRAFRRARQARQLPADQALDGMLIFTGALLLLFPGLVSDLLGIALVLPFTRTVVRQAVHRWFRRRTGGLAAAAGWPGVGAPGPGAGGTTARPGAHAAEHPGPTRPPHGAGSTDPRTQTVQGSVIRDEP